jgi:hypothetical protein
MQVQGSALAGRSVARVWGHEVAWGSDTGGQQDSIIASTNSSVASTRSIASRGKGGPEHRWIARHHDEVSSGADTAVSIDREVVSGHAHAILAPQTADGGRCGYDNPANLPVDGVFDP